MLKSIAEVAPELLNFIDSLELPLPQAAWWSQPAHIITPAAVLSFVLIAVNGKAQNCRKYRPKTQWR